jgi:hypothetical protein
MAKLDEPVKAKRVPGKATAQEFRQLTRSTPARYAGGIIAFLMLCVALNVAWAEPWTRKYIDSLPDSAFASVETAPNGKKVRHLPHHDRSGRVDLPHVRNALSRLRQVKWIDPGHAAAAREHLETHLREAREKSQKQP